MNEVAKNCTKAALSVACRTVMVALLGEVEDIAAVIADSTSIESESVNETCRVLVLTNDTLLAVSTPVVVLPPPVAASVKE
jgi:hypothetical protein